MWCTRRCEKKILFNPSISPSDCIDFSISSLSQFCRAAQFHFFGFSLRNVFFVHPFSVSVVLLVFFCVRSHTSARTHTPHTGTQQPNCFFLIRFLACAFLTTHTYIHTCIMHRAVHGPSYILRVCASDSTIKSHTTGRCILWGGLLCQKSPVMRGNYANNRE